MTNVVRSVVLGVLGFVAAAAATSAETLSIATYNVGNYGPAGRMTDDGYRPAYPKPEREKRALRQVIRALDADVLFLQEMGPQPYLDELQRDLRDEGCIYPHAFLAEANDAERHVAVLSKRPLSGVRTLANLEFSYLGARSPVKRGLVVATVRTTAGDIALFGFHLKSRLTERPDDPLSAHRRLQEAVAIRDEVLRRFPNPASARFVLIGDCNDSKASKAVERLQKRGKTVIALLLPASDPAGECWTYSYRREDSYQRVDHILVSPALRDAIAGGGARILAGPDVAEASDHRPVVIRLNL
ncbi:MAG TPA: endonuclease/exonuclease/phosphatase family protein [Bryobacteraceae bacterium]|nr:endonuclease/exonuclease/phosphatase family protein [Bryobacteraceae bacterium]